MPYTVSLLGEDGKAVHEAAPYETFADPVRAAKGCLLVLSADLYLPGKRRDRARTLNSTVRSFLDHGRTAPIFVPDTCRALSVSGPWNYRAEYRVDALPWQEITLTAPETSDYAHQSWPAEWAHDPWQTGWVMVHFRETLPPENGADMDALPEPKRRDVLCRAEALAKELMRSHWTTEGVRGCGENLRYAKAALIERAGGQKPKPAQKGRRR